MNIDQRKLDIVTSNSNNFDYTNLNYLGTNNKFAAFYSLKYYLILHITDDETFLLDPSELENLKNRADKTYKTDQATLYCYKEA